MKKLFKSLIAVLLFLTVLPLFSQQTITKNALLTGVRGNIVFPELTQAEKRLVAEQAQIFLRDLYVHRYQKMDYYGDDVDVVPAIAEIVNNIDNMTTAEMEEAIYKVFVGQRDLHLNYIFPAPYGMYTSFIPVKFYRVAGDDNFFEVRVCAFNAEQLAEFAPGQRVPEIGDELISYNDMSALEAVESKVVTGQGANRYGGFTRAVAQLTYIRHLLHLLPEEDEVTMTLRSHATGELYTVTIPWIAQWKEAVAPAADSPDANYPILRSAEPEKRYTRDDLLQAEDLEQVEYKKFLVANRLEPKDSFPKNATGEPTLHWGIIENAQGKFGYLNITSFSPDKGVDFALEEVIRIVTNEFADTKGLIIDVRSNGGGAIVYADKLSQLFMPGTAKAIPARLLNTPLNKYIFNNSLFQVISNPEWKEVINAAAPTDVFTATAPFTYAHEANDTGQIYYKPVAVLNNAESYSATDLFSCSMQDNGAAVIFGEDPQTGAGGANVITHKLFTDLVKAPFVKLPKGHRMRVSWRQSVRFGKNEGKLIEDYGCKADLDASRSVEDLIDGGSGQMALITQYLNNISSFYRASVKPVQAAKKLYVAKDQLKFGYTVINTDKVEVLVDGVIFKTFNVNANFGEKFIEVDLGTNWAPGSKIQLTVQGKDYFGQVAWNTKKNITILDQKVTLGTAPIEFDFATATDIAPLSIINHNTDPADGWNLVSPYLQMGFNPEYKNQKNSEVVLYLDLTQRTKANFSFTMEYDTEINYDFMEIYFTVGKDKFYLFRKSGKAPMANYSFNVDLTTLPSREDVVLHLQLKTDQMVSAPGVRISNISIK